MPRGPRLDAPGVLHHVMARGIEGRSIFRDDGDYRDLLDRVAALVTSDAWTIYAWALLPNHFHLLIRTGVRPLPRSMRSILTGYAGAFNRRHKRCGHLFQNRYKSIVVEEEAYFLELVRYIHLNPLRSGVVLNLDELDRYPFSGHGALVGKASWPWQEIKAVLAQFADRPARASRRYRVFMADGVSRGRRPELQGGGLIRSLGGWEAVKDLRRGREAHTADERVLGTGPFVEALLKHQEREVATREANLRKQADIGSLVRRIGATLHISPASILGPIRTPDVVHARHLLAYVWTERLGRQASELAIALNRSRSNITWAAKRGSELAKKDTESIEKWCK
jgi:putative transposase